MVKYNYLGILIISVTVVSIIAQSEMSENYTIMIATDKFLGNYLVNQSDFALYYFQNDSKTIGASTCVGECAKLWPPFHAVKLLLPENLREIDLGEIIRSNGSKQTTFKGWPLYLYSKDRPGIASGEGVKGLWHLATLEDQPQMI
ncbi:MAG: hypothetical protein MUO26_02335 [Methanotrichaceae archaeon]|nr:hypothetical protein [Methanotrichaceae archaeon]